MTTHYVTLMLAILGGVAIIGGALWRIGGALLDLVVEVKIGTWRIKRIEDRLGIDPVPPLPAEAAVRARGHRRRAV